MPMTLDLSTGTPAFINDVPSGQPPYVWQMTCVTNEDQTLRGVQLICLQPIRDQFGKTKTMSPVGSWNVSTLVNNHDSDMLFIDFGQGWLVRGMKALIREVKSILHPVDPFACKLKMHGTTYSLWDIEQSALVYAGGEDETKFKFSPETVIALIDKIRELLPRKTA